MKVALKLKPKQSRPRGWRASVLLGLASLAALATTCFALGTSFQGLSPIGRLLSPSLGLWRHQPTEISDVSARLKDALAEAGLPPVSIEFDEHEVPHIKSESDSSLYFAQGFVTAYFRLWQMDFLSRITAGRVSEILGSKALPIDRFFRRMLTHEAAKASSDLMMADPVTRGPLFSYTKGVNARIGQIDLSSLPVEYRIFSVLPEPWSEERAAHLLKFMTWELTGYLYDVRMTASKTKLSHELFELLFPLSEKLKGTILGDRKSAQTRAEPRSDSSNVVFNLPKSLGTHWIPDEVKPDPSNGSNSWALPGPRTTTGRPLLANDLHLGYTLPALWFSIQLTSPTMNVYGASLPGAPGVIVGFTETMGWALTNGTDDVLDWYSLRFRDEKRQEYMFEDSWRPVITREEVVRVAHGPDEIVQTRETHVGPIVFEDGDTENVITIPAGLAAQWTGHQPSNELRSFLLLNKASRANDCLAALQTYIAPAQNFVCADRYGKMVYKHAGLFPDRRGRDGRFVVEALRDSDLWQGSLPPEMNPVFESHSETIVTANQAPFNGADVQKFGWFFRPPYRSLQIRKKLDAKKRWNPKEMISLQADTESLLSISFKQLVLREMEASPLKDLALKPPCETGSDSLQSTFTKWTGHHDSSNRIGSLAHRWFEIFEDETWTRNVGSSDITFWPSEWRLFELIDEGANVEIWDDAATPEKETLNSRLSAALLKTCDYFEDAFGRQEVPTWSDYQPTTLNHAGRLPGLGRTVTAPGVGESIFANKGAHGPTWKMIVSFEDKPKAWTMIPGGQSGDPSSRSYDRLVESWSKGEMHPVQFYMRGQK